MAQLFKSGMPSSGVHYIGGNLYEAEGAYLYYRYSPVHVDLKADIPGSFIIPDETIFYCPLF